MQHESRHGFTLIELLVVISIIALLISLLLPALAHARALAKQIQGASNEHNIGIAAQGYATDHEGKFPPGVLVKGAPGTYKNVWSFALWTYAGYTKTESNPSNNTQHDSSTDNASTDNNVFTCPVTKIDGLHTPTPRGVPVSKSLYSYALNTTPAQYIVYNSGVTSGFYAAGARLALSPSRVHASDTAFVIEASSFVTTDGQWWAPGTGNGLIPHLGGTNVLFFDSHVKFYKLSSVPRYWGLTDPRLSVFWTGH